MRLRYISIIVLETSSDCKLISFRKQNNKKFLLYSRIFNPVATKMAALESIFV
jgi:hypothetical protein